MGPLPPENARIKDPIQGEDREGLSRAGESAGIEKAQGREQPGGVRQERREAREEGRREGGQGGEEAEAARGAREEGAREAREAEGGRERGLERRLRRRSHDPIEIQVGGGHRSMDEDWQFGRKYEGKGGAGARIFAHVEGGWKGGVRPPALFAVHRAMRGVRIQRRRRQGGDPIGHDQIHDGIAGRIHRRRLRNGHCARKPRRGCDPIRGGDSGVQVPLRQQGQGGHALSDGGRVPTGRRQGDRRGSIRSRRQLLRGGGEGGTGDEARPPLDRSAHPRQPIHLPHPIRGVHVLSRIPTVAGLHRDPHAEASVRCERGRRRRLHPRLLRQAGVFEHESPAA
mmetsp:Transcript_24694/g.59539  ORF Transcript_24694/g.59539 Transcript_24694/m.59539 type:complete len:341 (-) Transcript_24694:1454-2476(-)